MLLQQPPVNSLPFLLSLPLQPSFALGFPRSPSFLVCGVIARRTSCGRPDTAELRRYAGESKLNQRSVIPATRLLGKWEATVATAASA